LKKTISDFGFTELEPMETLFKRIEGLDNIFKFFGEEMDRKIEDAIPPTLSFLKYDEDFPTFVVNHQDGKRQDPLHFENFRKVVVDFDQIKNLRYRFDLNEDAILFGLDDLILKEKKETNTLYLSCAGIIKSDDQYFMIRRNVQANGANATRRSRLQHFRVFEIEKDEDYIIWQGSEPNMEAFLINADEDKYFQLKKEGKVFIQEWVWGINQTRKYFDSNQKYVFSAQQIFENEVHAFQNDEKETNWTRKTSFEEAEEQQTTANTTPRRISQNYENKFVSSEKMKYNFEKYLKKQNENEKEKQRQEKYERELHQFSMLRKLLIPILFDEEEDCVCPKKTFSDEEEKEFSKLYESMLKHVNSIDDENTVEGTEKYFCYRKIFNN